MKSQEKKLKSNCRFVSVNVNFVTYKSIDEYYKMTNG